MRKIDIWFNTREYEREHDRKPKGYGSWAFFFEGLEFWANGTYAEAKKACIAHIKSIAPEDYKGFVEVKVGA